MSNNAVKNHSIVIEFYDNEKQKEIQQEDLVRVLSLLGKYAGILHYKDTEPDTGVVKRKHYHIVLRLYEKKRGSTIINFISKHLDCSKEIITIDNCGDVNGLTRYLLHLDNPEKVLYAPFEIFTNDETGVKLAIEYSPNTLTPDSLMSIIYSNNGNRWGVIKQIGLDAYCKYEKAIRVALDEFFLQYKDRT